MRALPLILLASLAAPTAASAQPYDNYPVCLKVYGPASYSDCRYNSIAQCNESASGRSAQCLVNPWYTAVAAPPQHRRHRPR